MKYRVDFASAAVERQLEKLLEPVDKEKRREILKKLEALGENPRPHGVRKIKGTVHRIRCGPWRVVYHILEDEGKVVIAKVARRTEGFYRQFQ